MGDAPSRPGRPELLHYRAWRGPLRGAEAGPEEGPLAAFFAALARPWQAAWPIARVSLGVIFRRKLFWALYALALLMFLFFFFGQYLMAWAQTQLGESDVRVGGLGRANPRALVQQLRVVLKLDGSGETYRNFFWYEGYMVMVVLALAGAVLVGNDLRFGSLPFYLSKPLSRWHYLLGKALAVGVFVNLMTTLPALVLFLENALLEADADPEPLGDVFPGLPVARLWLVALLGLSAAGLAQWVRRGRAHPALLWAAGAVLFAQFGMTGSWSYFLDKGHLALGILGYGAVLTVTLTLVLLATATWLRRTVPMIMAWTTLFFFCRQLSFALVNRLQFDARWRLIDLWNSTYLVGNWCLGISPSQVLPTPQPEVYEAALVLTGVSLLCLTYLILRIRAVEVVK